MEIEITHLIEKDLMEYSASAMELGQNAGQITWNNSVNSGIVFVSTEEQKQEARDYIKEFGAWSEDEINAWTDAELNALILQFIAGDLREYLSAKEDGPEEFKRWDENCGGRIFETDDGKYYYSMSN